MRPNNEERLVWPQGTLIAAGTATAILYIHGFGASRAEGEASVEPIAQALQAVTYYTRLPGHGGDLERHAAATPDRYFERVEADFSPARPSRQATGAHRLIDRWAARRLAGRAASGRGRCGGAGQPAYRDGSDGRLPYRAGWAWVWCAWCSANFAMPAGDAIPRTQR